MRYAAVLAIVAALSACGGSKPDPVVAERSASLTAARFACEAKVNRIVIPSLNPFSTCPEAREKVMAFMEHDEDCQAVLGGQAFDLECGK